MCGFILAAVPRVALARSDPGGFACSNLPFFQRVEIARRPNIFIIIIIIIIIITTTIIIHYEL